MSNKQGTKFHPSSNFSKTYTSNTPKVACNEMPPEHTLIIEGHITSSISNTTRQRIGRHLRHSIITTCGDANTMHIDPALCIYIGAYLLCIDNKHLKDKVTWGNGTLCQVLRVCNSKKMHNVTNGRITVGRKCGQSMQMMLSGLNVNM